MNPQEIIFKYSDGGQQKGPSSITRNSVKLIHELVIKFPLWHHKDEWLSIDTYLSVVLSCKGKRLLHVLDWQLPYVWTARQYNYYLVGFRDKEAAIAYGKRKGWVK